MTLNVASAPTAILPLVHNREIVSIISSLLSESRPYSDLEEDYSQFFNAINEASEQVRNA